MKILVTGGSWFIGSHVVDKLREAGHYVRVLDMVPYAYRTDVEWYKGSVLSYDDVRFSFHGMEVAYHLAAVADVKDVYEDPLYSEAINVRGTIHVLEASRHSGIKRVIYGSTVWAYSESIETCVDEDVPLRPPTHLYTAQKVAGEYYCHAYSKLYGLATTILRYGIPYGPRARGGAVIPLFVSQALSGEPITIAGDGSQHRNFVYVEDLAEGNALALNPVAANRIYNLEGKESVTIRQVAEIVQKIVGHGEIQHVEGRRGDFSGKEISNARAWEELGWEPKVDIEEGIRRYVEWYRGTLAVRV